MNNYLFARSRRNRVSRPENDVRRRQPGQFPIRRYRRHVLIRSSHRSATDKRRATNVVVTLGMCHSRRDARVVRVYKGEGRREKPGKLGEIDKTSLLFPRLVVQN